MLIVSESWKTAYPEAAVGLLLMQNVTNPDSHPPLDKRKELLEDDIRVRFAGSDRANIKALPVMQAYDNYYKGFKKSYHVLLQLESVAFKGKSIPKVAALVEAMFMAELNNQLLTAGHDFNIVQPPIRLEAAQGDEQFIRMNGQKQVLKAGDMYIADAEGILSSVIYGPDQRTRITAATRQVLFTVYAPPGIEPSQVTQHLKEIESYVRLISPEAETSLLKIVDATS